MSFYLTYFWSSKAHLKHEQAISSSAVGAIANLGHLRSLASNAELELEVLNANIQKWAAGHPVVPASSTHAQEHIILYRARSPNNTETAVPSSSI